jgi:hypothetical protein
MTSKQSKDAEAAALDVIRAALNEEGEGAAIAALRACRAVKDHTLLVSILAAHAAGFFTKWSQAHGRDAGEWFDRYRDRALLGLYELDLEDGSDQGR